MSVPIRCLLAVLVLLPVLSATARAGSGEPSGCVVVREDDIPWEQAPAPFPPGTKMAVLAGDPAKEGPFTLRLSIPARTRIPPHVHPADERVTVVEGRFGFGDGESWSEERLHWLSRGDFFVVPGGAPHSGMARTETILEIDAVGPWGMTVLESADPSIASQEPESRGAPR